MHRANNGLVIGRFQLVGNNHEDLFRQIQEYHFRENMLTSLNIGIGIADSVNFRNPFSGTECMQMISPVAEKTAAEMKIPLEYRLVPDIHDPPNYAMHVEKLFGFKEEDSVTVFSNNLYTTGCFKNKDNTIIAGIEERINQHSSQLRDLYVSDVDISRFVPEHIPKYLNEHNAKKRLMKLAYDNPVPTVDVIVEYNGGIVVIERKDPPYGAALPGGHIDYGESSEQAALREVKEEINLDIKLTGLIGVYSNPERDPRGHKISIAYSAIGSGELKAKSDAKNAVIYPINQIPNMVFDHNKIIDDYIKRVQR